MALARLALKNVQQRTMASSPSTTFSRTVDNLQKLRWSSDLVNRFSTAGDGEDKTEKREVAVSEGGKKSKLFPRRRGRGSLGRRRNPDFAPAIWGTIDILTPLFQFHFLLKLIICSLCLMLQMFYLLDLEMH